MRMLTVCGARPWILLSNAAVAFLLNIAAVFLVGAGSGLVLTLAGVFKVRLKILKWSFLVCKLGRG